MMEKVVLIIPEDKSAVDPMVYPPLGLLYITSLIENLGYETEVFDLRDHRVMDIPEADYYGFTSTTQEIEDVREVSNSLDGTTFIGGSHATHLPENVEDDFDCVVIGEGEQAMSEILEKGRKGIIKGDSTDIDSIPYPARHLLPDEKIVSRKLFTGYRYGEGPVGTTLISSRGCPFKCSFCANIPKKVRFRSVENLVNEIKVLKEEYDCTHFRFLDDHFALSKKRLKRIVPRLSELDISFRCSARSDAIDQETCELLKEGGCKEIGLGIESADDQILELLNKREKVEDHKRAIEVIKENDILVKVFLMVGLPKETWETIEKNKRFIKETRPDKWIATLFIPYPGSDVWNHPSEYGVNILTKDFTKYHQTYPSKSVIETDVASDEELNRHFEEMIRWLESDRWR